MHHKKDFFPQEIFNELQEYIYGTDFQIICVGNKILSVLKTPEFVMEYLELEGHDLIISFIRESYDGFDNDLNIHADHKIDGKIVSKASVTYLNRPEAITENGTAFYAHKFFGNELPGSVTDEVHDRMLLDEANDITRWQLVSKNKSIPNSNITYSGNLFHSKYPANIDKGLRIVLVAFYSKK